MYVNRNGVEIKSVHIWLPAAIHRLVKEDGLNLSQFVREQLEVLYGEQSTVESLNQRVRLVETARDSLARQREIADEAVENRERLREVVRQMRKERRSGEDEAAARAAGIREALDAIVEEGFADSYRRMLPENDPYGDRIDDWERLVAQVSQQCRTVVDAAEVAAELRRCVARGPGWGQA